MQLTSFVHAAVPCGGKRGDVGLGITFEQRAEHVVEFGGFVFRYIGQRVEKHEFRHERRERIVALYAFIDAVDGAVAVGEIFVIGLLVQGLLLALHIAQFLYVGRIAHGLAIF